MFPGRETEQSRPGQQQTPTPAVGEQRSEVRGPPLSGLRPPTSDQSERGFLPQPPQQKAPRRRDPATIPRASLRLPRARTSQARSRMLAPPAKRKETFARPLKTASAVKIKASRTRGSPDSTKQSKPQQSSPVLMTRSALASMFATTHMNTPSSSHRHKGGSRQATRQ